MGQALSAQARKVYEVVISEGTVHGKRPEHTGCGLVRSAGDWHMLKSARVRNVFLRSYERILGDCDLVETVIASVEAGFVIS
jgi:hypothetical protein